MRVSELCVFSLQLALSSCPLKRKWKPMGDLFMLEMYGQLFSHLQAGVIHFVMFSEACLTLEMVVI